MHDTDKYVFGSLTRISDLEECDFGYEKLGHNHWATGDYVLCEVTRSGGAELKAELPSGRMMELMEGDLMIGALGVRHATLEATGTWKAVEADGRMHLLTGAGLMGRLTSKSAFVPNLVRLQYLGHIMVDGLKKNMQEYVPVVPDIPFNIPIILLVGTSMSAGKTTSARIITRQLKQMDLKVVGAKLTGAGRYKDILAVKDAGADAIYDFVDVGLPSSIHPREEFQSKLMKLLHLIAGTRADVAVIEIGASPLEPYNGDLAIQAIKDKVKCTVLCASDPYSVLGVMKSFDFVPTIVNGPAVNTLGGEELIHKLCGVRTLNLIHKENLVKLKQILMEKLELAQA